VKTEWSLTASPLTKLQIVARTMGSSEAAKKSFGCVGTSAPPSSTYSAQDGNLIARTINVIDTS
jgi:hypothetical protein